MKQIKYFIFIIGFLHITHLASSQIASDTVGCVPLLVRFKSPNPSLNKVVWDFNDGASSNLLNPNHVYTKAGLYKVTLKNADTLVATVSIRILPELSLKITADNYQGCAPISINFTDITSYPNALLPLEYLWDFGDGKGSTLANPLTNYTEPGIFSVTLSVKTKIPQCNTAHTFEDFINVQDKQDVDFTFTKIDPTCSYPTMVTFKNTGVTNPDYTYLWNFDNGTNSTKPNPDVVSFSESKVYQVSLEVDNKKGCRSKITKPVNLIFYPKIKLKIPSTFCLNQVVPIINETDARTFSWDFGPNAIPQTSKLPSPDTIKFTQGTEQKVKLTMYSIFGCKVDTSFVINISQPDATFTADPLFGCSLPVDIKFIANHTTYEKYEWNNQQGASQHIISLKNIQRDSFYYNKLDSIPMILKVTDEVGCMSSDTINFYYQLPNAQFSLSAFEGEAPFLLKVFDKSESFYPIVKWIYDWGDGTSDEYNAGNVQDAMHLYETPGSYYVNLSIFTENGCSDLYYGAWIQIHQKPTLSDLPTCSGSGSGSGSGSDGVICYKDSISITLTGVPKEFDAFHIKLGNSISHCEDTKFVKVPLLEDPDEQKLGYTLENGGVFYENTKDVIIKIGGAKSKINYQTNCKDPKSVFFENNSIQDLNHYWIIEGKTFSADTFTYKFKDTGDYKVTLIAENDIDGCKPDTTEVYVPIRNIRSKIATQDHWCDGSATLLSSVPCEQEIVGCKMGYTWSFPKYLKKPPIITDSDSIYTSLPGGNHKIQLEVRDVNGCKDTSFVDVIVHTLTADFTSDLTAVCDSATIELTDQSFTDNVIKTYSWNVDPTKNTPNITHTFGDLPQEDINIILTVKDSYGCVSSFKKIFNTYKPTSYLSYDSILCQSNLKTIEAGDFTLYGSNLDYFWKLDGKDMPSENKLVFPPLDPGTYNIQLKIIEKSTHCKNYYNFNVHVIDNPQAIIGGIKDSVFCYPKTLVLSGDSSKIHALDKVSYQWNFGNNIVSTKVNPLITYTKGNYTIRLIVQSKLGCADTTFKNLKLIGPEGQIVADKDTVCKGEDITFTLVNPKDLTSFFWDFGQGKTDSNKTPATYQYDFVPESGKTFASIVLESSETGCETVLTLPVGIFQVVAGFTADSTCNDSLKIVNLSQGADQFIWKENNKIISKDNDPWIIPQSSGTYPIQLIIHDSKSGCNDTITKNVTFLQNPQINLPDQIQLCENQIYSTTINPSYTYTFTPQNVGSISNNKLYIQDNKDNTLSILVKADNGCVISKPVNIQHNLYEDNNNILNYVLCNDLNAIDLTQHLSEGDSLVWTFNGGELPDGFLSCTTCDSPVLLQELDGQLKSIKYNENSCQKTINVYNLEIGEVEIPNFFSPNDDQVNDIFRPVLKIPISEDINIINLKILNRWGKEVYSSDKPWDGKINGQFAPAEVYYFSMTYQIGLGCLQTIKGDVTLMR